MNMIEKVAKAIDNEGKLIGNEANIGILIPVDDACKRLAKAAILAIREPTDNMIVKGDPKAEYVKAVWQAMIDAALKEE